MRTMMFMLMVSMLSMSVAAQYNTAVLNQPVDTTYFLGGELDGNWNYGVLPEAQAAYRNHLGAMTMIVSKDSVMLEGNMYAVAYSKMYRNRKVVLLIDWDGKGKNFAEMVIVLRKWPFGPWYSAMLVAPKIDQRYSPDPVYFELYKVENHWLSTK
jgi:hypothetical protein